MVGSSKSVLLVALLCCFVFEITGNVVYHMQQSRRLVNAAKHDIEGLDGCSCDKASYTCSCCIFMDVPQIGLNTTACLDVRYIPRDVAVAVDFTLDGKKVFTEEVSARNPPPICFGVPEFKKEASICIKLYKLDITTSAFSGCASVEVQFARVIVKTYELGCFKIPLSEYELNEIEHKM